MGLFIKKIQPEPLSDASPVLLLHGFCEDHSIWTSMLPAFEHRTVYLVDLPGFGQSSVELPQPLSIDWVADSIYQQVIQKEKVSPTVLGHSLGGYVALALAEKYGTDITGICLFHSTTFADTPEKKETRNKVIEFVKSAGVKTYTSQFVPGLFHSIYRRANPDQVQQVVDLASQTRLETLTAYAAAMRDRPDRSQVLQSFSGQKLVIAGDKDGAVPLEQSLAMKEMVGPSDFVLLNDVAHMGMYERREECIQVISSWG